MSRFFNIRLGLIILAVVISAVFLFNIYGFDESKVTRIYEGSNVSQPYILYTIVDDKVFEGFSGSVVIRLIDDDKIFKLEGKESKVRYSIKGDQILDASTNEVKYIFRDNVIYKGGNVDTTGVLYRIRPNGWIMDKSDKNVIYTCEGECDIDNLASTILLK